MKTKNILKALTASLLGLSLLTSCANASKEPGTVTGNDGKELKTLRVANMTGQPDQYADFIGMEQGIFEKYGISLVTTEFVAGINTVDSIVTGTADTGLLADYAAVNRFGNTLANNSIVIFSDLSSGSSTDLGGIYVASKYANDINALDGSEGWLTQIGTVSEYYNWQAQTYLGLDPDKQNLVQMDSVSTALALAHNGGASAVVANGSQASKYEAEGWVKIADSQDAGINIASYLVTTKDFAEKNTELLSNYLKALNESVEYLNNNLDDSAKKISERFGIDEEIFKQNWVQYIINFGLSEQNAAHLDEVNAWAFEHNKFPESYNVRQFYFDGAAKLAFPENVTVDLSGVQ